jgi:hypothetical protein
MEGWGFSSAAKLRRDLGALQAAEKLSRVVILSGAKDLALRIFLKMHRAGFFASVRMTVSKSFSAARLEPV